MTTTTLETPSYVPSECEVGVNTTQTPLAAIVANCRQCTETRRDRLTCVFSGDRSGWCPLWVYRFGVRPATAAKQRGTKAVAPAAGVKVRSPIKAIREYCLQCAGTVKAVAYCSCDGVHSTACPLWLYRFGCRPASAAAKYGDDVVDPSTPPEADACLDQLLINPAEYRRGLPIVPCAGNCHACGRRTCKA